MEPTLTDGQGLVAVASRRARSGQLRCVEHPERPGFWLVKRVEAVHGDTTTGDTQMTVLSDNRSATMADSRSFGPVPVAGSYRVVLRIPRRLM
jgi:signal peptidase I